MARIWNLQPCAYLPSESDSGRVCENPIGRNERRADVTSAGCDPEVVCADAIGERVAYRVTGEPELGDVSQKNVRDGNHRGRPDAFLESLSASIPKPATSAPNRSSATVTAARKIWFADKISTRCDVAAERR